MCELLAMNARHPARLTRSLTALAARAEGKSRNRDGWGIGYYQGKDVQRYRDTAPADASRMVPWLEAEGPATTMSIGYIRHATQGQIQLADTGPFVREWQGRRHLFAHNGHLSQISEQMPLAQSLFTPIGKTDSETAFCLLLERMMPIWRGSLVPSLDERFAVFTEFARTLQPLGPANLLYSDGDALFVFADQRLQPGTGEIAPPALHILNCPASNPSRLQRDCLSEDADEPQQLTLVSTVPLSDESWQPLKRGESLAIQNGQCHYRTDATIE